MGLDMVLSVSRGKRSIEGEGQVSPEWQFVSLTSLVTSWGESPEWRVAGGGESPGWRVSRNAGVGVWKQLVG